MSIDWLHVATVVAVNEAGRHILVIRKNEPGRTPKRFCDHPWGNQPIYVGTEKGLFPVGWLSNRSSASVPWHRTAQIGSTLRQRKHPDCSCKETVTYGCFECGEKFFWSRPWVVHGTLDGFTWPIMTGESEEEAREFLEKHVKGHLPEDTKYTVAKVQDV